MENGNSTAKDKHKKQLTKRKLISGVGKYYSYYTYYYGSRKQFG